jgi:hypothetical protein
MEEGRVLDVFATNNQGEYSRNHIKELIIRIFILEMM